MVFVLLLFFLSLACGFLIVLRITGSALLALLVGIGLGFVGMTPMTCLIIVAVCVAVTAIGR